MSKRISETPKNFPFLSLSLLGGFGAILYSKVSRGLLLSPISFIKCNILECGHPPVLEAQKKEKPVLLFDFNNFLSYDRFSFSRFDSITHKRAFCEEFLFNMAHYYEIICVSDRMAVVGDRILKLLDPLECMSYRIFLSNKRLFDSTHLNRDISKMAVISTSKNEFHDSFDQNLIMIDKFTGKTDSSLLDLMHFFINLHYTGSNDFRDVLKSYQGFDFINSFKTVQKRLFKERNLFSLDSFERKLNEINKKKIEEYKIVETRFKNRSRDFNSYRSFISGIVKSILL